MPDTNHNTPNPSDANPDAALIAACEAFMLGYKFYDAHGGAEDATECPLFAAVNAAEDKALSLPATTLAGLRAKAAVAQMQATSAAGHNWSDSFTGDWPASICRDLLAMKLPA